MFFKKKKEPERTAQTETAAAVTASESAAPATANEMKSGELIAVISAAIAAFTAGEGAESRLVVRKISRIHGEKVSWSNAGLMESIDSRRF